MSWREITLGDAFRVKHGYAFKSQFFSEEGEYIVLTPGNFDEKGGFRLRPGKDRFYTGDIPEDFVLDEGSLIVAMTEQGQGLLGSSAMIPTGGKYLHNQRLGLVQDIDDSVLDKRFLYYLFNTKSVRASISASASGVKVRHTAPERIYRVKAKVPKEVSAQKKIASSLAAYDDLIENNRRRIQLLEQAARLLYREWFVHLRFPGHEHVPITDGVPEGWERKSLSEAADSVSYGLTASSTQDAIGPKFLRITDIVTSVLDWDEVPFCEADDKEMERNRLEVGDVVVARTGATVGYAKYISRLPSVALYASYLVRFRFGDPSISVMAGIFMESAAYKEYVKNHAGGAAQPNANATVLGSALMLIPPGVLRQQFSDSMTPILSQRDTLIEQNGCLTKARDLLLPRLMSGEVPV